MISRSETFQRTINRYVFMRWLDAVFWPCRIVRVSIHCRRNSLQQFDHRVLKRYTGGGPSFNVDAAHFLMAAACRVEGQILCRKFRKESPAKHSTTFLVKEKPQRGIGQWFFLSDNKGSQKNSSNGKTQLRRIRQWFTFLSFPFSFLFPS